LQNQTIENSLEAATILSSEEHELFQQEIVAASKLFSMV